MQLVSAHQNTSFPANTQPISASLAMTLPPEILTEIFSFYIHSPSPTSLWDESHLLASAGGSSPFPLSHICSYWRNVILNTPTLWSSLYIENPTPDMIPQVQIWLARAGNVGLRLTLRDWLDSEVRECDEGTKEILRIFVQRSRNWKSVDFVLELKDETVFDELNEYPSLEEARLIARYWNQGTLEAFWSGVHRKSPNLRRVNWWRAFNSQEIGLPRDVPWERLQSITTSRTMSDEEVLFILQACPELVCLNSRYSSSISTLPSPNYPIVQHNRLGSLSLHLTGNSTPLFNYISLPALKALHLVNECEYDYPSPPSSASSYYAIDETIGKPIEECLKRSPRCRLEELVVHRFEPDVVAESLCEMIQRLLDLHLTRELEYFDVYPLPSVRSRGSYSLDLLQALAKHPAWCVRDAALSIEEEQLEQVDRQVFVRRRPTAIACEDPEKGVLECEGGEDYKVPVEEIDAEFEFTADYGEFEEFDETGMTSVQAMLAHLHD